MDTVVDLIKREELEKYPHGSYFIPHDKLREITFDSFYEFEDLVLDLVELNPDYQFTMFKEALDGMTISWRKI